MNDFGSSDIPTAVYKPLVVELMEVSGLAPSLIAMRLPRGSVNDTDFNASPLVIGDGDLSLARRLVKAGDEHGKFARGIDVYIRMTAQVGWLLHWVTYRIGVENLSSSSVMNELKRMHRRDPIALANDKQERLPSQVYTRIEKVSFQTLARIYRQRRHHAHNDWRIFCDFIETVPYFDEIYQIGNSNKEL